MRILINSMLMKTLLIMILVSTNVIGSPSNTNTTRQTIIPSMVFAEPQPISLEQGRSVLHRRKTQLAQKKLNMKGIQVFDDKGQALDFSAKTETMAKIGSGQSVPELTELARALKNDVDLIYEYVRNNIEFSPFFGLKKGAVGAILEGRGTSWDQALLMLMLLRESGFDETNTELVFGEIEISPEEFQSWWQVKDISAQTIGRHLAEAYRPYALITEDGTNQSNTTSVVTYHSWIRVNIEGIWYHFDPSFKAYQTKEGIDLSSALNYVQSSFLAEAKNGALEDDVSIQAINSQGIDSQLTSLTSNLISHIKTNMPNASLADIIGGGDIVSYQGESLRQTALPNGKRIESTNPHIPIVFIPTLEFTLPSFSLTVYAFNLTGKKITLTYDDRNRMVFSLNEEIVLTSPVSKTLGTLENITIKVNEPYLVDGAADQTSKFPIIVGASYLIVNAWGSTGRNTMEFFRQRVSQNQQNGLDASSRQATGDSLAMFAAGYLAQGSRIIDIVEAITDLEIYEHHAVGLVALADGPYIDLPMNYVGVRSITNDRTIEKPALDMFPGYQFGFESTTIEQMTGKDAVSTVSLFDYANQLPNTSNKFFDAKCDQLNAEGDSCSDKSTYLKQIKSQLTNYSTSRLATIEQNIDQGYRLILPQSGTLGENDWNGYAFIGSRTLANGETSITYKIGNDIFSAKGGFGAWPIPPINFEQFVKKSIPSTENDGLNNSKHSAVGDPISWQTGDFFSDYNDISIGSAAYPFGLSFSRSYNSGSRLSNGAMGWGWDHNYNISATLNSDGFQGLGDDSPIDAAAAISSIFVNLELMKTDQQLDKMVIMTLGQQWLMDQLTDNLVMVTQPGKGEQFVLLPDGSYNPPPESVSELSKTSDGSYHYRSKNGIELDFNVAGQAEQWTNPNGVTVDFNYTNDLLTSINNSFGHQLTLSYNNDDKITGVTDGTGRSVSYNYDDTDNLTSYSDVAGEDSTYQYDKPGRMTQFFQPDLPTTPVVINVYNDLGQVKTQANIMGKIYHYYFAGKRSEELDPLGFSQIKYFDSNGLEIQFIDKLGNKIVNEFDNHRRLVKTTLPEGNITELGYDQRHNPVTVTVYPKPCLPQPCTNLQPLVTNRTYETTFNQLLTSTDPAGQVTTNTYSDEGNLLTTVLPQVTDPDSGVLASPTTTYTYNNSGQILTVIDPTGLQTSNTYDVTSGYLLSSTLDPGANKLNLTTDFTYNSVGDRLTVTDPRGNKSTFQYNNMRQLTKTIAPSPIDLVVENIYDKMGRMIELRRGPAAKPSQVTKTTYTRMGNVATVTSPDDAIITNNYDSLDRLESVTDSLGRKTQTVFDAKGQVLQIKRAVGTSLEQVYQTYTYGTSGSVLSVADASGNKTDFTYDNFNRLSKTFYPKAGVTGQSNPADYIESNFDTVGNVISQRTRSGTLITFKYDLNNRPIQKTVSGSPARVTNTSFDLAGRIVKISLEDGQNITNIYDPVGRVIQVDTKLPSGKTKSINYQFDESSNRTKIIWPDGYYIDYEYDELNRMSTVTEKATLLLASYQYDKFSRRTGLTYGNGGKVDYSYDIDNTLAGLDHDFAGDGIKTLSYDYSYDAGNQLTGMDVSDKSQLGGPSATQLTNYTANGLNQYTGVNGDSVSYDSAGNLTAIKFNGESHQYSYNPENILIEAITPTNNSTYHYGPMNKRVAKNVNQGTVHIEFLHDRNETIAEYSGKDGALIQRFIFGPGVDERIARILPDGRREYYALNHQASTIGVTDDAGVLTDSFSYDPFGNSRNTLEGNPYRFTGRRLDPETGLYYYRARYYSPLLGRFLQTDPLGYGDGMNMYAYVGNSPMVFTDPQGLERQNNAGNARADLKFMGNTIRNQLTSGYEKELFERYWLGGGDKQLTEFEFKDASNPANLTVVSQSSTTKNETQYILKSVSYYGNPNLDQAYGSATLFYNKDKAVGFYDNYDFDPQPWGQRSRKAETKTRAVHRAAPVFSNAASFKICYGIGCE